MDKRTFCPEKDGFYGVFYPHPAGSKKAMILMLGDSSENRMVRAGAKWLHKRGCHVTALSPEKKGGYHSYSLERIERAVEFLKAQGNEKIGIVGASATGMLALTAASLFPDIRLTIAMTPPDFVMEGYYKDGLDGARERPGNNESSLTWRGQPLAYLPYAYRHPEYWQKVKQEAKETGNRIACRNLFDESERQHPVQEAEKIKVENIKVENIKGKVIFVGAEDDALWDTCKYVHRMELRLESMTHECEVEALFYQHGTHFVFPESMLKTMLPVDSDLLVRLMFKAAREHPKECRQTRLDIDKKLSRAIQLW